MDQKILFDGVPRDEDQMHDFNSIMQGVGRDFQCVHILLDPEIGIKRILERASIEGRADDTDESFIRRRMEIFQEKTMPVLRQYEEQGKVIEVDGNGTIEEVYDSLKMALGVDKWRVK